MLFRSHPYEEVAYDIYNLENTHPKIGSGIIGELASQENEISILDFKSCSFIKKERTADYTTTFRIIEMIKDKKSGDLEDASLFQKV